MSKFISPVNIIVGPGVLQDVPSIVQRLGGKKVFIIADPGIVKVGIVDKITSILNDNNVPFKVYSDLIPEPPISVADKAVQSLRSSGADFVIGIGGGSSLDVAKAASVLCKHEGSVKDYLNLTGTKRVTQKGLPLMLIPTTAGTGSEVTDIAVFSLENTKDVITDPLLMADVALVDPELTYSLPHHITASTGVDALTHALEAYISVNATPLTDALAIDAIKTISSNIRTAVWNGKNKEARQKMAWGSLIAGLSFYNAGVSGVHALAYPLGGLYHLPHGVCNAVMLPYVFDYIWPSCMNKMAEIAVALGINIKHLSIRDAAIEAVREMYNIVIDVGIPVTLKDHGIKEGDLEALSRAGIEQKRLLQRSPKPYTLDDIRRIYRAAYDGVLRVNG